MLTYLATLLIGVWCFLPANNDAFIGYYRLSADSSQNSTFFLFGNDEVFDIYACEDSSGLTYMGFYEEEDANFNLQAIGYQTSTTAGYIYRMDVMPLTDGTFPVTFSMASGYAANVTFTFDDAAYVATLLSAMQPERYECVIAYEGTMTPLTIHGLSATGPGLGDEGPPENVAVVDANNACYFYEPGNDYTLWHPGLITPATIYGGNIHIGEYSSDTLNSTFGINVIARYNYGEFIIAFCRVTPKHTFEHIISEHTSFCKTFTGLILDETPYRTCPLCANPVTVGTDCQHNTVIRATTTADPESGALARGPLPPFAAGVYLYFVSFLAAVMLVYCTAS